MSARNSSAAKARRRAQREEHAPIAAAIHEQSQLKSRQLRKAIILAQAELDRRKFEKEQEACSSASTENLEPEKTPLLDDSSTDTDSGSSSSPTPSVKSFSI